MIKELLDKAMARPFTVIAICIMGFLIIRNAIGGSPFKTYPAEEVLTSGQDVNLTGYLNKIEFSKGKSALYLRDATVSFDSKEYPAGCVILNIKEETDFHIGSFIGGYGKAFILDHGTNPGEFDEYNYYKSIGIDLILEGEVEWEDSEGASSFLTFLSRVRRDLSVSIDRSPLEEDEEAILKAMVLGDRSKLTPEIKSLYKNAGIIHLISISGLHISIIGMGLYRLLRRLKCTFGEAGIIAGLVMVGFVLMTGGNVSSRRALVAFVLMIGSEVFGRTSDPVNTLSLAAAVLLISGPYLLYNTGFLLSFASVLGIGLFVERTTARTTREKILSALKVSAGLWLFTLPVIVSVYFEYPLYSIFVNLIVVTLSPVLLTGGILGALSGLISPFAGMPFFIPAGLVIKVNNALTDLVSALPGAVVISGSPGWIKIVLYYVGIGVLLYIRKKEKLNKKLTKDSGNLRATGLKTLIIGAMISLIMFNPRLGTKITFLDVGQGDSILIRCGNGSNIMIDSGSGNVNNVGEKRVIPCLKAYGVSRIDRFIITHPDADHINALDEILASNIEVGEILVALVQSKDETNKKLFDKVEKLNENSFNKTKIRFVQRGDSFEEGETSFKVIFPGSGGIESVDSVSNFDIDNAVENQRNALSVVVEMCQGNTKVLFTGDLEKEGEEELINSGLLEDIDILKVAHHGSKYSTSEEFLRQTKPEIAVISCGRKNSYGHPHKETIRRLSDAGCRILTTPECGAVELVVKKATFFIHSS